MKHPFSHSPKCFHRLSHIRLWAAALLLALGSMGHAQVATGYTWSQVAGGYTAVGAAASNALFTDNWDDAQATLTLPFTFYFNGVAYTQVTVSSNGFLVFGNTLTANDNNGAYQSNSDPSGAYLNGTGTNNGVAGFNVDMDEQVYGTTTGNRTSGSTSITSVGSTANLRIGMRLAGDNGIPNNAVITNISGSTVTLSVAATSGTNTSTTLTPRANAVAVTTGTAPNRTFVVQYTRVTRFGYSGNDDVSLQIRLNEGNNNLANQTIEVVYGTCATGSNENNENPQVGIRSTTSDVLSRTTTTDWTATTAGTNTSSCRFRNTVAPPSGRTYIWTPGFCSGAVTAGSISGTSPICTGTGTTLTLGGMSTASYGLSTAWFYSTVNGGPYTNSAGSGNSIATGNLTAARYYVATTTCANGATSATTAQFAVVVNAAPTTANAGPDLTACTSTGSATMAANIITSGAGTWTQTSGTAATITTPGSPTTTITGMTTAGSRTFRWTAANSPCANSIDDVIIVTSAPPSASAAGPDQTICSTAGSATMNATAPGTGTGGWTQVGGPVTAGITTPSSRTTGITGMTTAGTYTFRWTITSGPCTPTQDDVDIVATPGTTTSAAGPDQTICVSSPTATMAANTPVNGTGTWTQTSGPSTATIVTPGSPTTVINALSSTGTYVFQWAIANAPCATSNDAISVIVRGLPSASAAGTDQTICSTSGSATMNANNPGTGTGGWTQVGGPAATITTPSSRTTTITGMTTATTYSFRWTITNSPCTATQDDVDIISIPGTTTSAAGPDQTICVSSPTATMAANTPVNGTGTWTQTSGPSTATIVTPGSPTTVINALSSTGTYVFQWAITNAPCATSNDAISVIVRGLPSASAAGPDQTICSTAGSATMNANNPGTGTGGWTQVGGPAATITTPSSRTTTITGMTTATTYSFRWTITNSPCTATQDDVDIISIPGTTISAAGPDQTICANTPATLAANAATNGNGVWSVVSGPSLVSSQFNNTAANNAVFTPAGGAGTYTLRWTIGSNSPCANSTDDVVMTVNPIPAVPTMLPTSAAICPGGSTGLSASSPNVPASVGGGGTISITDFFVNTTSPYPSSLTVSGFPTSGVTVTNVTLNGVSHTEPVDMDLLLRSPSGTNVILLSDIGGTGTLSNANYVIQDGATAFAAGSTNASGTYAPTNAGATDNFASPGPGSVTQAAPLLSGFSGNVNGSWDLFLVDDATNFNAGSISSWSITFSVPVSYAWSPATGLNATNVASVTASPAITTLYTATVSNPITGCQNTNTVNVVVNARPTATLAGNGPFCASGSPQLTGTLTGTGPWSITYTTNGASPVTVSGIASSPYTLNPAGPITSTTTYAITAISDANCSATVFPASVNVVVNNRPTATLAGNGPFCASGAPQLTGTLSGTAPWSITYTTNGGSPVTVSGIAASPYTIDPTGPITGTTAYAITAISDANCSATAFPAAVNVVVNARPTATLAGNGPFCASGAPQLTGTLTGAGPWSITYTTNGASPVTVNSIAASPYTINPTGPITSTTTYEVTAISDANCAANSFPASVNVVVNNTVNAGSDRTITLCSNGSSIALFDSLGGAPQIGGNWTYAGSPVSNTFDPGVDPAGGYSYTVLASAPCLDATATVTVMVNTATTWYADTDGDLFGDPNVSLLACSQPIGYVDNGGDLCTDDPLKQAPGQCGCGVEDLDTDEDGTADCVDGCPFDDNKTAPGSCGCGNPDPGSACDDGDNSTGEDTVQPDCTCAGVPVDCNYVVNGTDLPGTPCDDGNPDTQVDTWSTDCLCEGQMGDCLGTPGGTALPGSTCDDGEATTGNDVYMADCTCAGELIDCEGTPGGTALTGTPCDDGNTNTANDTWDGTCTCVGTPVGCQQNGLTMELKTDNNGAQNTWEIIPIGGGAALCSGNGSSNNTVIQTACCLADGCYRLLVYDTFGDGIAAGGYRLLDANSNAVIDNWNNYGAGASSAIANNGGFCLPLSADHLNAASTGRMDLLPSSVITAAENAAVSAQYGVGDQTDDGYQFWLYDPNGSYSRTIFKSHANHTPGTPYGATACANLILSSIVTNPVPANKLLNVKVRARVNGVYGNYGQASRNMIDLNSSCPTTQLVNAPNSGKHSCGATKTVNGHQKIYANNVPAANKYQWRFENTANSYVRTITSTVEELVLNIWITSPLLCGTNVYDVTVRVSFDNGGTYCPYGPVCQLTVINNSTSCTQTMGGGSFNAAIQDEGGMHMWPNPARDGNVTLELDGLSPEAMSLSVDIYDPIGKRVYTNTVATEGAEQVNTTLAISDLATGLYTVSVTSGDRTFMQRLVVE